MLFSPSKTPFLADFREESRLISSFAGYSMPFFLFLALASAGSMESNISSSSGEKKHLFSRLMVKSPKSSMMVRSVSSSVQKEKASDS